ncbi:MAG: VOC family protein [Cyanothece sp. SIO2G6]|nr:VOC family protein [Cyanothece sp. SIO2G6]
MITQSLVAVGDSLLEIDHIFVCVDVEPDPREFSQLGLLCSERVIRREEQGTASRLIFFNNVYLELVWIENPQQAEIYAMRSGVDYLARSQWRVSRFCPFGIALRHSEVRDSSAELGIFEQTSSAIDEVIRLASSNLVAQWEPLCYIIPSAIALTTLFAHAQSMQGQLTNHALGIQHLTHTSLAIQHSGTLTSPISMLSMEEIVELKREQPFELILTFDSHRQGQCLSLASLNLPITLKY